MLRHPIAWLILAFALPLGASSALAKDTAAADWSMNATIIEACSCPMFCQCYFSTAPASHHGHGGEMEHFCKFNNAFRVNTGHSGSVKLDGVKFWVGGDLGGDFSQGKMNWAVLTFDPSATKEQRDAVADPGEGLSVTWNSFTVGPDAPMTWTATRITPRPSSTEARSPRWCWTASRA
jgi:hypothetical protein